MRARAITTNPQTCARKAPFPSWGTAAKVGRKMLRAKEAGREGAALRPYRCVSCGHWHLGRPPGTEVANG